MILHNKERVSDVLVRKQRRCQVGRGAQRQVARVFLKKMEKQWLWNIFGPLKFVLKLRARSSLLSDEQVERLNQSCRR